MSLPLVKNKTGFSTIVAGTAYNVREDHASYRLLLEAVANGDEQRFLNNVSVKETVQKAVQKLSSVGVSVEEDRVLWNGKELNNVLVTRILEFQRHGLNFEPLVAFLTNLLQNPSSRAIEELYPFLENECLPITEDGHFLAYKTVSSNFYSKTAGSLSLISGKTDSSGHIFNGVGEVIECARNEVDDVAGRTCSHGLHVGALAYAGPGGYFNSTGDKVVIVKVNPRDAVSVPADHNAQKLRCCKYEVVQEYVNKLEQPVYNYNPDAESLEGWDTLDLDDEVEYREVSYTPMMVENVSEGDVVSFVYHDVARLIKVTEVKDNYFRGFEVSLGEFEDDWSEYVETSTYKTFRHADVRRLMVAT